MSLQVDIASGHTRLHTVDLRLPGYIPLHLSRTYQSELKEEGLFGVGWRFNLDIRLRVEREYIVFEGPTGGETYFKPIEVGMQVQHPETGLVVQHHPDAFVVLHSPRRQCVFSKPDGARGTLHVDRIEDATGNHIQFAYRGARLTTLADTVGRRIDFEQAGGRVVAIHVSGGQSGERRRVRSFRYDRHGDLVAEQDAAGRETTYEYRHHRMVAHTNRLGGTRYAQYDDEGHCITLWHSDGAALREISYDGYRQTARVINTMGAQTLYRTLGEEVVLKRIGPLAEEQYYHYDEAHHLLGFTSARGELITFQHLEDQTLTQIDGERSMAVIPYNEVGLAEKIIDPFEQDYVLDYDQTYHLTGVTTPRGDRWAFAYDRRGWVSEVTSPEGRWVRREMSSDGITVEDELGLRYKAQVDLLGREVERTDALGRRLQRAYDPEGRLTEVVLDGGYTVQFSYTAEGHLTHMVDSEGRQVKRQYDAFGRLQEYYGPDQERWQFQYDREGRLVEATNARRASFGFSYDDRGWLSRFTPPNGDTEVYHYDDEGIIVEHGDTRRRHVYSPLGELVEAVTPDGGGQALQYGPFGELRLLETGEDARFFDYDAEGRLETVDDGVTSLLFSYDRDGHLATLREEDGREIAVRYDARGRPVVLRGIEGPTYEMTYDGADRLTALVVSSGEQVAFRYDALDRLRESTFQEEAGRGGQQHVFDRDDAPIQHILGPSRSSGSLPADSEHEAQHGVVLLQAAQRLVVAAQFGELSIPLWVQQDLLHHDDRSVQDHVIYACVEGMDALMARGRPVYDVDVLQRWSSMSAMRFWLTAVPGPREVTRMPLLRSFFLHSSVVDRSGALAAGPGRSVPQHHWRGSFDPLITGTHREGALNPPVWEERRVAPHVHRSTTLFKREGVTPDDVLRLSVHTGHRPVL